MRGVKILGRRAVKANMRTMVFVVLASLAWPAPAYSACLISNETDLSFVVTAGAEIRDFEPRTTDSFRSGAFLIENGDTALTGFCSDGARFVVRMVRGPRGGLVAVLVRR